MARRRRAAPKADSGKWCKDCLAAAELAEVELKHRRPTPYPGPRCKTHHLTRRKALSQRQHGAYVETTYGITGEQYGELHEHQDGHCWCGCGATGATKRLAVDHDHETGYVRGLLCSNSNKILGHFRDDPERLRRMADYLENPPAFAVIGKVVAPIESVD